MANNKGKKVLITGGAGFIGSNLGDVLIANGHEVHVIDNLSNGKKENLNSRAILHTVDIRDVPDLEKTLKKIGNVQGIFHLAALPRVQYSIENPKETHEVNVTGTHNILELARTHGNIKVVYAASSSVYGDQAVLPLHEDVAPLPKSPYALQKYMGELLCRLYSEIYNLPTVSLRYFNVYGPKLDPDGAYALVVGKFLKQRQSGAPLTITGDGYQTRDFTHVRDVAMANILALNNNVSKGEAINIGAGNNIDINALAKLIGGEVQYISSRLEPRDTLADNTRAKELLGWQPSVMFEEGIEELRKIFDIK